MSPRRTSTRSPLWRRKVEDEVSDELEFHFEMRVREYLAQGLGETVARARAHDKMGDLADLEDRCRRLARRRDRHLDFRDLVRDLLQDIRAAMRQIRREPGFALSGAVVLALGIGAVTTVFGIVQPVLLDTLPLERAERLLSLGVEAFGGDGSHPGAPSAERQETVAPVEVAGWQQHGDTLERLGAWVPGGFTVEVDRLPTRVDGVWIGEGLLELLRLSPTLGRGFGAREHRSSVNVVLISERLWRDAYAAQPSVLGSTLRLEGEPYEIVGVLPGAVQHLWPTLDVAIPLVLTEEILQQRASYLHCIARLRDGVDLETARAALSLAQERTNRARPEDERRAISILPLERSLVTSTRPRLWLLFGSVITVLLVACTNVANLLLARALGRDRELGVRAALGAGRGRILRQLLTEGLVLTTIAATAGVAAANFVLRTVADGAASWSSVPGIERATLSPTVLVFAAAVIVVSTLLSGLVPALRAAKHATTRLRTRASSATQGRLHEALVAIQVAAALMLLSASGLLVRSAISEGRTELGFRPEGLLTAQLSLPVADYPEKDDVVRAALDMQERALRIPGVLHAAVGSRVALAGPQLGVVYLRPDQPERTLNAELRLISPDYFSTLATPILEGREFRRVDHQGAPPVVVVNWSFAKALWPEGGAIGRHLTTAHGALVGGQGEPLVLEVVGIVADARDDGLRQEPRATAYISLAQTPAGPLQWTGNTMMWLLRTQQEPTELVEPLRRTLAQAAPGVPAFNVATMERRVRGALALGRVNALLFSGLGLTALFVALGGIYGLTAFVVSRREFEIGVRLALGATKKRILRDIVGRALLPVLAGVAIGCLAAMPLGRLLESQLVGAGVDAFTVAGVIALVVLTAFGASLAPARRTAKIDPARILGAD